MDIKRNWLYMRIASLKLKQRGWKVIVPIVKEGEHGDYHTIMWMWFYIIVGRNLYQLESDLDAARQVEYRRCA